MKKHKLKLRVLTNNEELIGESSSMGHPFRFDASEKFTKSFDMLEDILRKDIFISVYRKRWTSNKFHKVAETQFNLSK